jgi:hypothetical protein
LIGGERGAEGGGDVGGTAFLVGVEASPGPNLVANNLAVGCPYAVEGAAEDSAAYSGNYTYLSPAELAAGHRARGAVNAMNPPNFRHADAGDYRLAAEAATAYSGVSNALTRLVRHDFNGLLRFPEDAPVAGAFRAESGSRLEVEFKDGSLVRSGDGE